MVTRTYSCHMARSSGSAMGTALVRAPRSARFVLPRHCSAWLPRAAWARHWPRDLAKVAREQACGPVQGFFERSGMIDLPSVYGYLPGEKEERAAFCGQEMGKPNFYLVVFVNERNDTVGRCPTFIRWKNHPRGLSLSEQRNSRLLRRAHDALLLLQGAVGFQ